MVRGARHGPRSIAAGVGQARRHHQALHPTSRWPRLLEPAAGRSDLAGPATRPAHRDASDRTRSAARLDRAAQTAHKLNWTTDIPQAAAPTATARHRTPSVLSPGGTASIPVREKGQGAPVRNGHVPSHVPSHAQTAAKVRGFSPTAAGFTAETDWPLEGEGFEPLVPGRLQAKTPRFGIVLRRLLSSCGSFHIDHRLS